MKYYIVSKNLVLFLFFTLLSTNLLHAQIVVNSNFEGGNGVATFTDLATNEVHITSELKGGDTRNISYYVEISGLNPAMPLTFTVTAEWRGHSIVYSYDSVNWHKIAITNLNTFVIPLTSPTVYVAHSYPYTYSNMISDVADVSGFNFVNVFDMAISEGGRPVKLIRITDDCLDDAGKELIWIFGRTHAFENPGNICVKGMLDFFVSNHPNAQRLREEAIIYIVPMMDVDMAYNGGSGKDQTPIDFNRDWVSINNPSHWNAVKAAKIWIDSTAQLNNFSVFMDSHSPPPSHKMTTLFYYINNVNHHLINTRFITQTIQHLGNYQGEELLYTGLSPAESQDYIISNYDNPKHYNVTMETGFTRYSDSEPWTKDLYLLNGEYHALAISDYIHGHANDNDILIDNDSTSQVVLSGTWTSATTSLGYFGADYIYADALNPASITFNASIDTAGEYEIFTRWVSDSSFATNAAANFNYSGGSVNYTIDMSLRGGNWVSLGTFYLNAGEDVSLIISNTNANQTVVADGLRISKVIECQTPSVQVLEQSQFNFNLYPNPVMNQFIVQLENASELEYVKVYNSFGKLVLHTEESIVNTSSLSPGLYIVEVKTNQGQGVKKIIVQ